MSNQPSQTPEPEDILKEILSNVSADKDLRTDYITRLEESFATADDVGNTKELVNVVMQYDDVTINAKAPSKEDEEERNHLFMKSLDISNELKENPLSRRAMLQNDYPGGLKVNCIVSLQFLVRHDRVHVVAYSRSMNYDTNFKYDTETFAICQAVVAKRLGLEKGRVTVFITSLHRIKK